MEEKFKEYVPRNATEEEILDANPTHNPNFDFSDDAYFEEYILKHKNDFDFMVQVAKVQGDNCINLDGFSEISVLLAERPLVILEAVQHFDKNSTAMPYYMLNYFDVIGETDVLDNKSTLSQEYRNFVFDFVREKLAPFEYNPDLVYELCKKIDYKVSDLQDDMQKLKEEFDSYGMLSPYAKADLKEEKIFTAQKLSPEEIQELERINKAERVAKFKQKYNSMSVKKLLEIVGKASQNTYCPYLVEEKGDVEYFSGLSAIILASKTAAYRNRQEIYETNYENVHADKMLNPDESDVFLFDTRSAMNVEEANPPREDFKFTEMVNEVFTQLQNARDDDDNKIDFCKIVEEAESNALKLCYEKDAEKEDRIAAIKNIDVEAKPKTNAEKLQRFCKKAMQSYDEDYLNYLPDYQKLDIAYGECVADGVKSFLLTTPNVKLEQLTKLIDYVAPDAVYSTQVNKYSDVVKKAVREDDVFRNRLKIARAKGSGISR